MLPITKSDKKETFTFQPIHCFIKPESDVSQNVSVLQDIASNSKINNEMRKTSFWVKNQKSYFTLLTPSGAQRRPPLCYFVSSLYDTHEDGDVYLSFDPIQQTSRKTGHAEAIWVKPDKTLDVTSHFNKNEDLINFMPFVIRFANSLDCTFIGLHVKKPAHLDSETLMTIIKKYYFAPTNLVKSESGDVLKARKLFLSKPIPLGQSPQFTWSSTIPKPKKTPSTHSSHNESTTNTSTNTGQHKRTNTHRSPSRPKRTRSVKRSPPRQT